MKRAWAALALVGLLGLGGCANMDRTGERMLMGSAIGAGTGAIFGAVTGGIGTGVGAAVGAAVGAGAGFLMDQVIEP